MTEPAKPREWTIPLSGGKSEKVVIANGDRVFIVGPNGVGKSALMQHCAESLRARPTQRILAHRQTWMPSSGIDLTPKSRREMVPQLTHWNSRADSRWQDNYAPQRLASVLFDLVAAENERARRVTGMMKEKNVAGAAAAVAIPSPFERLNELMLVGNLTVQLRASTGEEILAAHGAGKEFSMAKLSDGERNAAILAAVVLTVEPDTLLLIDEPERHLHRSIIEPFLSALFECRKDCPFVVSTHDLAIPVAARDARVVLPRACEWQGDNATAWTIDILQPGSELPDDLRYAVLGSRKKILFVEGEQSSLDKPIYGALFEGVSVVPKGGCSEVIRAVKGLRGASDLHWVEALGLIDKDDRQEPALQALRAEGIHGLDVHSVEALYFSAVMRRALAERQAGTFGGSAATMLQEVTTVALDILKDADTKTRLCARRCEAKLLDEVLRQAPDWKAIASGGSSAVTIHIASPLDDEKARYQSLLDADDLDGLIARYPVRETSTLDRIARKLRFNGKTEYEQAALAKLASDEQVKNGLRALLGTLTSVLITTTASVTPASSP